MLSLRHQFQQRDNERRKKNLTKQLTTCIAYYAQRSGSGRFLFGPTSNIQKLTELLDSAKNPKHRLSHLDIINCFSSRLDQLNKMFIENNLRIKDLYNGKSSELQMRARRMINIYKKESLTNDIFLTIIQLLAKDTFQQTPEHWLHVPENTEKEWIAYKHYIHLLLSLNASKELIRLDDIIEKLTPNFLDDKQIDGLISSLQINKQPTDRPVQQPTSDDKKSEKQPLTIKEYIATNAKIADDAYQGTIQREKILNFAKPVPKPPAESQPEPPSLFDRASREDQFKFFKEMDSAKLYSEKELDSLLSKAKNHIPSLNYLCTLFSQPYSSADKQLTELISAQKASKKPTEDPEIGASQSEGLELLSEAAASALRNSK